MGYIFLFISMIAGTVKGYCGKKTSGYTGTIDSAVFANLIRMVLCIFIGALVVLLSSNTEHFLLKPDLLAISALSGVSTSVFVVCWLISVRKNAYMMVDIFLTAGVIITLVLCNVFFDEKIRTVQWLGFVFVVLGAIIMCSYNSSVKTKINLSSVLFPIACSISNGVTDFSQKLFVKSSFSVPVSIFNFYTYVFSALTLLIVYLLSRKNIPHSDSKQRYPSKMFGYILVMSICLFAHSYFKTVAAGLLDAIQIYPLLQGSALILSTLMAALLFHEKITAKSIAGTAITFSGLIIINLL